MTTGGGETGTCGNPRASDGRSGDDLCGWFCNRTDRISWRQAAETAKSRLELLVRLWISKGKPMTWSEVLAKMTSGQTPPQEVMVAFDKLQSAIDVSQGILGSDIEPIWNTRSIVEKLASAVNHGNCAIETMMTLLEDEGVKVPNAPPPATASSSSRTGLVLGIATFALIGVGVYYARKNYMLAEGASDGGAGE